MVRALVGDSTMTSERTSPPAADVARPVGARPATVLAADFFAADLAAVFFAADLRAGGFELEPAIRV